MLKANELHRCAKLTHQEPDLLLNLGINCRVFGKDAKRMLGACSTQLFEGLFCF